MISISAFQTQPSLQEDFYLRLRSSCVIHAIGDMGTTEHALEYTCRYRHCYPHVFSLHAQSS